MQPPDGLLSMTVNSLRILSASRLHNFPYTNLRIFISFNGNNFVQSRRSRLLQQEEQIIADSGPSFAHNELHSIKNV